MYFHTPLLAKNAIISIVSVSVLAFLVSILSKFYRNVSTIFLKFLHENILGTSLEVKVIASIIFYITKYIFF